jgi:hypothetical protein
MSILGPYPSGMSARSSRLMGASMADSSSFAAELPPMAYLHQSRFQIGDLVFGVLTSVHHYWRVCPICEGTGRVKVAGHEEMTTYCPSGNVMGRGPKCSNGKIWEEAGKLFEIRQLHIGQIRVVVGFEPKVEYMAEETGIGSGSLWNESKVFATEEEAEEAARADGAVRKAELCRD